VTVYIQSKKKLFGWWFWDGHGVRCGTQPNTGTRTLTVTLVSSLYCVAPHAHHTTNYTKCYTMLRPVLHQHPLFSRRSPCCSWGQKKILGGRGRRSGPWSGHSHIEIISRKEFPLECFNHAHWGGSFSQVECVRRHLFCPLQIHTLQKLRVTSTSSMHWLTSMPYSSWLCAVRLTYKGNDACISVFHMLRYLRPSLPPQLPIGVEIYEAWKLLTMGATNGCNNLAIRGLIPLFRRHWSTGNSK
jgi:hypothetical protein